MKIKNAILGLTILLVLMLSAFAVVAEVDLDDVDKELTVDEIEINGKEIKMDYGEYNRPTVYVDRGDDLEVKITLWNRMENFVYDDELEENVDVDIEDAIIRAYFWYEDADEEGTDDVMEVDLKAGAIDDFTATLALPDDLPQEDLKLFIQVYDQAGDVELFSENGPNGQNGKDKFDGELSLTVKSREKHMIKIKDIMLHPESRVMAGDLLTAQVRLENIGEDDTVEDDIKVTARVVGLEDAMDSTYLLTELDYEEDASTEPLSFYIPLCAKGGEYTLEVEVEFDDGDETETSSKKIMIVESDSDLCAGKPVTGEVSVNIISGMQVLSESQRVATFPVVITNNEVSSKAFVVSAEALGDWASEVKAQETSVVVDAGKTKTVLVLATAREEAQAGKQLVSIKVKDTEGNTVKEEAAELTIAGSVKEDTASKTSFRKVLEIGLIVLVILLVLLGLIIGFNKLKDDEEDLEEEDKSYY